MGKIREPKSVSPVYSSMTEEKMMNDIERRQDRDTAAQIERAFDVQRTIDSGTALLYLKAREIDEGLAVRVLIAPIGKRRQH